MNLPSAALVIVSFLIGLLIGTFGWWLRLRYGSIPSFLLHHLFDSSPLAVYLLDMDLRYRYINPRALGGSRANLHNSIGKQPTDVMPPEILGPAMQHLQQALDGNASQEKLSPVRGKDQQLIWRKVIYFPVRDQQGKVRSVMVNAVALQEIYEIAGIAEREATLLDSIREAVILTDLDSQITSWNRGARQLFGYSTEEALGKSVTNFVTPDMTALTKQLIFETLRESGSWSGEVIGRNKKGDPLDIELKINRMDDLNGFPIGYVGIHNDVTERKKVQRELQEDGAMLRGFFQATTVFTGIIELLPDDLKLVMCNQRMAELYGYSVEELLAMHLSDLPFSEAVRQSRLELYRSCWETGNPLTTEYSLPLRGQDYYFQESISPIRDSNSGSSLLSFAAIDITDRRRAEDELRRLNTELEQRVHERTVELQRERNLSQTILDSMGEGVIYSEEGAIRYVNRAMSALTDYSAQELVGSPDGIFLGRDPSQQQDGAALPGLSSLVSDGNMTWRGERAFFRKNGSKFNAALTVSRLINLPQGDNLSAISGVIVLVRDISEEKQLEAQKSRFIADASHELRTPLTNITTRLYLLRRQPEQSETHITALENAVNRATELVEDLLDINRFERRAVHLVRQRMLLQDLVMMAVQSQLPEAAAKNILLGTDLPPEEIFVLVDPNRFLQVIVNLLTNAINYTPEGGRVTVQLGVETLEESQYTVLRVRDTGIGIPPEHLPHISEPFYRVDHSARRGTGLGLSIAKEIIQLHEGTLIVESVVGVGSTFGVLLPVVS